MTGTLTRLSNMTLSSLIFQLIVSVLSHSLPTMNDNPTVHSLLWYFVRAQKALRAQKSDFCSLFSPSPQQDI